MNRQRGSQADRQYYGQKDTQTFENLENSHTDVQKGGQTDRHVERWTIKQTEVQKSVQINE
jgi:hypothetical protein